jgi:hypothetical protein
MTWTKLPDTFCDDPQLLDVPRDARLLYVEALVWCNRLGTDGAISRAALRRLTDSPDPEAACAALIDSGLWAVTETGWQIVDFLRHQRSADDVERVRAQTEVRNRRWRQHNLGDHSLCRAPSCRYVTRDETRDEMRHETRHKTPTRSDPSRPDPTRPVDPKGLSDGGGDGEKRASGSSPQAASPPRPSPTARGEKGDPVGSVELPLPAAGSARPCDLTIATSHARDEHVTITIEAVETTGAAANYLRLLVNALRLELADAKRLHRCPRTEGNRRICQIGMHGAGLESEPDPDADEPPTPPLVTFHVPVEFSRAWLDVIRWELTYGQPR